MRYITTTDTAKALRAALKEAFPKLSGRFFSVKTNKYAGGSSIDVTWTDGPAEAQVEKILAQFRGAFFDASTDMKERIHQNFQGEEVNFGVDYVNGQRMFSEKLVRRVADAFSRDMLGGRQLRVFHSSYDQRAWVEHTDKDSSSVMELIAQCSEDDSISLELGTLEVGLSFGRFALVNPKEPEPETKQGMLTKAGADKLGYPKLAGQRVYYQNRGDDIAYEVAHPDMFRKTGILLPLGSGGIIDFPACIGILTAEGAQSITANAYAWKIVRYNEQLYSGVSYAVDIYTDGNRIYGKLPLGYDGVLPKQIGRSFHWAAQDVHFDIIKSVKQNYYSTWIDGIEVTVTGENGEEFVRFDFSWYQFDDGEITMKLEMRQQDFQFLDDYRKFFQKLTKEKDITPYAVAQLLQRDFGFARRQHA